MPSNKGMDWVRLPKRMAIYFRDGFRCIWCKLAVSVDAKGYKLTLDHVYVDGSNEHHNLVTCCLRCNSSRQRTLLSEWLVQVSKKTGEPQEQIAHRVLVALGTPLNMNAGRRLALLRRPRRIDGRRVSQRTTAAA